MARPLSADEILRLTTAKTPRKSRSKSDPNTIDNRIATVWFALDHKFGVCSNETCPDMRPKKTQEGIAMCAVVGGRSMCRLCFLDGYGLDNAAQGGVE